MKIVYDVVAKGDTYQKDGKETVRWIKCGVLMESDKGKRIKLDCLPTNFDGWLGLFDREEKQEKE